MTPQIYTSDVALNADDLREALSKLADFLYWVYLESEPEVDLTVFDIERATQFPAGQAFGPNYEARWEAIAPDAYHFEVLTEVGIEQTGLEYLTPSDLELTTSDVYTILLWGVLASTLPPEHALSGIPGPIWVETRIPRPLEYPVEPVHRVGVRAVDYKHRGVVVATRWLELVGLEAD